MAHHKISKATHFTGPVLFSNQVPSLENLNTGAYPDQRIFFDDFGQQVYNGNVIGTSPTAGAAMGLDGAVTNHSFGVAAFAFALILIFAWTISGIVSAYVISYKKARKGELGQTIEWLSKTILGSISIIMVIVALIIH